MSHQLVQDLLIPNFPIFFPLLSPVFSCFLGNQSLKNDLQVQVNQQLLHLDESLSWQPGCPSGKEACICPGVSKVYAADMQSAPLCGGTHCSKWLKLNQDITLWADDKLRAL